MDEKGRKVRAEIIKCNTIAKSDKPLNMKNEEQEFSEWIAPSLSFEGLKNMVEHSSILPQCISAYKSNIAGFGLEVRYKDDVTDTKELESEFERLSDIVELLTFEYDTKEIFEKIIENRETYGIAYLEVIRNGAGEVVEIEMIENVPSIEKSRRLGEAVDYDYYYKGMKITRKKQFRKYRQNVNGKTVYFKEFGDRRIMDSTTGEYHESVPFEKQANEILEFKLGSGAYGQVRWIGQSLSVEGSRKAENLNNNYFDNGRHTPLAVLIKGGTLTEESFNKLQDYMNDIKGEKGQHAFLLLEAESDSSLDYGDEKKSVDIEIKDLAGMLQHDELFQDYLENNRKKVQSAFRLPDLYVGYTTDFNRATAQTAMEVTEKQVFQPERKSMAWIINNKLLNEYGFEHVEVYFKDPDITNPDDLYHILNVCSNAGGLTPNKAKEVAYNALGEVSDDYEGEWGNVPIAYSKTINGLDTQIAKAADNHDDEIVAIMKSVRALLIERGGA
ncbi:phage portal protein [Porcipelethomonas sp.]|uniref:phage portal protein n=1 Tax=Porcipelethomonas sp. TaxID=2981675 RepID=UPI003EF95802